MSDLPIIELLFTISREDPPSKNHKDDKSAPAERIVYNDISFLRLAQLYREGLIKYSDYYYADSKPQCLSPGFSPDLCFRSWMYSRKKVEQLAGLIEPFEKEHVGTSFGGRLCLFVALVGSWCCLIAGLSLALGLGPEIRGLLYPVDFLYASDLSPVAIRYLFGTHTALFTLSALGFVLVYGLSRAAYFLGYGRVRHGDREIMTFDDLWYVHLPILGGFLLFMSAFRFVPRL